MNKNTRNTENPYELISGIRLSFENDKSLNVAIHATKFDAKKVKKAMHLTMSEFNTISPRLPKKKGEVAVYKVLNNVSKFAKKCKNPIEVISIFMDAYNANKDIFTINISTAPVYPDSIDKQFVLKTLI